jgi:hypothetical protein
MAIKATATTKDLNKLQPLVRCKDTATHQIMVKVFHLRTWQLPTLDTEQALRLALSVTPNEFPCIRMNLALTEIFLHAALPLLLTIMVTDSLPVIHLVLKTTLAMLSQPVTHPLLKTTSATPNRPVNHLVR